jgi:PAS domain S-box-containing protein
MAEGTALSAAGVEEQEEISLLEAIQDACLSLDRGWRVTSMNAAAEKFFNRPRQRLLGRSLLDEFPQLVGSEGQKGIERVFAGGKRARFETISVISGSPIELDVHPHAEGVALFVRDVGARWMLEEKLREREALLRLAEESAGVGVWEIDVASDTVRGTPQYFRIMGLEPSADPVPMGVLRALRLDGDRERVVRQYAEAARGDSAVCNTEFRIRWPDGRVRWIFGRGTIFRDTAGRAIRYSGVDIDVTDRKAAEIALAESEDRLRMAIEAAEIGIWDWNLNTNEVMWNETAKKIAGLPVDKPVTLQQIRAVTHPADLARTAEMGRRARDPALRSREPFEYRIVRPDGAVRWVLAHGEARFMNIEGVEKAVRYAGTIQDITDEKAAEEHRELMLAELQHRVRNTLALVQAIANQTFAEGSEPAKKAFSSRLSALGRAHDLLTRERWQYASCREVVEFALAPYRTTDDRFAIDGPEVRLDSRQAVTLALCINELATNAAKYGALSDPNGRVAIRWTLEPGGDGETFIFRWSETDGPPVAPPLQSGFGTRLIQHSLAADFSGEISLAYPRSGLICTLSAPWRRKD